jgi:hypothetical protein
VNGSYAIQSPFGTLTVRPSILNLLDGTGRKQGRF